MTAAQAARETVPPVRKALALSVAAAAAATVVIALAALLSHAPGGVGAPARTEAVAESAGHGEGTSAYWNAAIAGCSAGGRGVDYDEECLTDSWLKAWESGNLSPMNEALLQSTARTPILGNQCHSAGHEAGRRAWSRTRDAGRLLAEAVADEFACNNGFVHGIMDGMAGSNPGDEELEAVYGVCEGFEGAARPNCIDGSGHATWQATHDTGRSLELCNKYRQAADRGTCFAGVMMQMYLPDTDGSRPAEKDQAKAAEEVPYLCDSLEGRADAAVASACRVTGGGFLAGAARDATAAYVRKAKGEAWKDDPEYTLDDVKGMWGEAFNGCRAFGDNRKDCELGVVTGVAWFSRHDDITSEICTAFPDSRAVSQCLESKPG